MKQFQRKFLKSSVQWQLVLGFILTSIWGHAQNLLYENDFESGLNGASIQGSGELIASGDDNHGQVFHNAKGGQSVRVNYLVLPNDIFADLKTADTKQATISFWVNKGTSPDYYWTALFAAYAAAPNPNNTSPMFVLETRGWAQVNDGAGNWCDFSASQKTKGTESTGWIDDGSWHFYAATMTQTNLTVYIDGVATHSWSIDGTTAAGGVNGLLLNGNLYTYITLGGNQAWNWNDPDPAFYFDDVKIYDAALTAAQVNSLKENGVPNSPTLSVSTSQMYFDDYNASGTFTVDGANLTSDVTITAPTGITVDPTSIASGSVNSVTVTVTFDGSTILSDKISVTSGGLTKEINVATATNDACYAAVYPSMTNMIADPTFSKSTFSDGGYAGWGPKALVYDDPYCGIGSAYVKGSCWPDGGSMDRSLTTANGNALKANTSYRVRAMIKNETANSGAFQFQIEGYDGSASKRLLIDQTSGWEQFDRSFKTGATVVEKGIYFNSCETGISSTASDYCYIDNYEMYEIPNTEAGVYNIALSAGALDVAFDAATMTYIATVPFGTMAVTPSVETIDPDATVAGNEAVDLTSGAGSSSIIVTARDQSTTGSTYTINYVWSAYVEWNGAWSNTNGPSAADNVLVSAPLTVSGDLVVKDLFVNSSGSITVESGAALAIMGAASGQVTVERNTTGSAGYSIVGSCVSGADLSDLAADYLYTWDGSAWSNPTGAMAPGKGYFLGYNAASPKVSLTGALVSGNQSVAVSTVGDGFNLVANPYAAAISITSLLANASNIDAAVYLWDDGGTNVGGNRGGDYVIVNGIGVVSANDLSDGVPGSHGSDAAGDGYIGSMQGFFVHATSDGNLDFTPSMQSTAQGANDDANYYRTAADQATLKVSLKGAYYNEVLFGFRADATEGVDTQFDALKLIGNDNFSFYSFIGTDKYAIQGLPSLTGTTQLTLGYSLKEAGVYELSVNSLEGISASYFVYAVVDGKYYDITSESAQLHLAAGEGRINLELTTMKVLSADQLKNFNVYSSLNKLNVQLDGNVKTAGIEVFDLVGRRVFEVSDARLEKGHWSDVVRLNTGEVYILRVQTTEGIMTKKFVF